MDSALLATLAAPAPELFADRYVVGEELGRGGFGTVHAAVDRADGATVALKRFHDYGEEDALRFGREAAALRLLRHPGVVRLLDHGVHDGTPYIVMERVSGAPFPGRPGPLPWSALAPLCASLLEVLGAVHDAGIIHRDLKPSNILVNPNGRLTLLDFGLARGAPLGPTLTQAGAALGTPFYLAPEQAFGQHAGPRTDLWSVGALLYEALTGQIPHAPTREDLAGFLVRRGTQPVPPLLDAHPEVPAAVAATVDALLALAASDRPTSARHALALLTAEPTAREARFPELRPDAVATARTIVVEQRTALDLSGPRGAGHGHLLDRLAETARTCGQRPIRAVPARLPYQSLVQLIGTLDIPADASLAAAHAAARDAAHAAFAAGALLLVDDATSLDAQSERLLADLGPAYPIARAVPHGTAAPDRPHLHLAALPAADFAQLFAGPDRILHLREDAAHELHRRSRGLPGPAIAELERWLRSGLAERDGDRVRVSRANLERLASASHAAVQSFSGQRPQRRQGAAALDASAAVRRASHLRDLARLVALAGDAAQAPVLTAAWPGPRWLFEAARDELTRLGALRTLPDDTLTLEGLDSDHLDWQADDRPLVHAALGAALAADDPRRMLHFVAAGRVAEAVAAALGVARRLIRDGLLARANAILHDALALARASELHDAALHILVAITHSALFDQATTASHKAAFELRTERNPALPDARLTPLRRLVEANIDLSETGGRGLAALLGGLAFPDDPELWAWVWSLRVREARGREVGSERAVVEAGCTWAETTGHPTALAHANSWRARLAYREGKWETAAAHSTLNMSRQDLPRQLRISAATNAASALIEARRFDDALAAAAQAQAEAAHCRDVNMELRAAWLERLAAFRRGDTFEGDAELIELADLAGAPYIVALLRDIDAGQALRAADGEHFRALIMQQLRDAERLRMTTTATVTRPLVWLFGPLPDADARREWRDRVHGIGYPGVRLQALTFMALAAGALTPEEDALAETAWAEIPEAEREGRLDVLSPAECRAVLEASRAGQWDTLPAWLHYWAPGGAGRHPTP